MKKHYEKVITLCCFLFLFTNVGLTSTSFNVYQPYIIATDGVGDVGGCAYPFHPHAHIAFNHHLRRPLLSRA